MRSIRPLLLLLLIASPPSSSQTRPPGPLRQAAALNNQGARLADQERYLEAESKYRQALRLIALHAGPDAPESARPLNNLAVVYRRLGRLRDAETRYLQSLALRRRTGDETGAGRVRINLARLYLAQERRAEAQKLLDQSSHIPQLRAERLHTQAALQIHAKQYPAAARSVRQARQAWIARNQLSEAAQARAIEGESLRLSGRIAQSLPVLRQAVAELTAAYGPRHPEVGRATAAYARALKASGDRRRAKRVLREARAILAQAPDRAARSHIVDLRSGYTRSR